MAVTEKQLSEIFGRNISRPEKKRILDNLRDQWGLNLREDEVLAYFRGLAELERNGIKFDLEDAMRVVSPDPPTLNGRSTFSYKVPTGDGGTREEQAFHSS